MSDALPLVLDGQEFLSALRVVREELTGFQAQIMSLAETPATRLRAHAAGMATSAASIAKALDGMAGQVERSVTQSMERAAGAAQAGGRRVGRQITEGIAAGMDDGGRATSLVREQVRKLQAEYEGALAKGWKVNPSNLQGLRTSGVSLSPDDRRRLTEWVDLQRATSDTLARRRKADAVDAQRLGAEVAATEMAQLRDVAGFRHMLAVKTLGENQAAAAEKKRADAEVAANTKAQLRDVDGYQQMLALRARARAKDNAADLQAQLRDVRAFNHMNDLRLASIAKVGAAGSRALQTYAASQARSQMGDAMLSAGLHSSLSSRNFGTVVQSTRAETGELRGASRAAQDAARAKETLRQSTSALSQGQRGLAESSREVHSAMRGVAGAAGALFLTYGSLIPLTTAFFAASSVRDAIDSYAKLEYQLTFVKAVAEDATLSISQMSESVTRAASNAGVMPVEAAKGLRLLAQAGLTAQQSLDALPTVLNVATIGEISMEKATNALTGATYAFGVGLDNIGRIGDVYTKAGAISSTSVESIAESMKYASTVAETYKLSVEDVSVALVAMARRNITGSSAGTAYMNMMTELASPRGLAKKVSAQLGVELFNPALDSVEDFYERFVPQLRAKIQGLTREAQADVLNALTNNRASKALGAILSFSDAELGDFKAKVGDATGFAARAMIDLNDTLQRTRDRLAVSFTASLEKAGAAGAGPLREALERLRAVVESPNFINAVTGLVNAFTLLVNVGSTAAELLMSPAGMVGASGAAMAALTPLPRALLATAAGMTGISVSATAATSGAAALLLTLGRFVGVVGVVVTVATTLGMLYAKLSEKDHIDQAAAGVDRLIAKEQEYGQTLLDNIDRIRRKNAEARGEVVASPEVDQIDQQIAKAEAQAESARARLERAEKATRENFGRDLLPSVRTKLEGDVQGAQGRIDALQWNRATLANEQAANKLRAATLRAEQDEMAKRERAHYEQSLPSGKGTFKLPEQGADKAASSYAQELKRKEELEISAARALEQREADALQLQERRLKAGYDQGLTDYASYQAALTALHESGEAARRMRLDAKISEIEQRMPALQAAFAAARAAGAKTDPLAASNALESERQKLQQLRDEAAKLGAEAENRRTTALTQALAPSRQLLNNSAKEFDQLKLNTRQALEQHEVKADAAELSERQLFIQQELNKLLNPYQDKLQAINTLMREQAALGVFDDIETNEAAKKNWQALIDLADKYRAEIAAIQGETPAALGAAFDGKRVQEERKRLGRDYGKWVEEFSGDLAQGIIDAGKDGGKSIRKSLEDELVNKPFKILLQATLEQGINAIGSLLNPEGAAAYAAQGGSQTSTAMQQGQGMLNNILGLANGANKAYSAYTKIPEYWEKASSLFGGGSTAALGTYSLATGATGLGLSATAGSTALAGLAGSTAIGGTGSLYALGAGSQAVAGGIGLNAGATALGTLAAPTAGAAAVGAAGTAGTAGTAAGTGALGAMGPYGWVALAVLAVLSMVDFSGEKRFGGQYGVNYEDDQVLNARRGTYVDALRGDVTYLEGPSGGEFARTEVSDLIKGSVTGINEMLKTIGSDTTVRSFQAGVETSDKDRGGVFSGGTLSTGQTFGEPGTGKSPFETTSTRSPDAQTALKNLVIDLEQSKLQVLQVAEGVPESLRRMVAGLDIEALSDSDVDYLATAVKTHIETVGAFRKALEALPFDTLRDLSFDAAVKLAEAAGGMSNLDSLITNYFNTLYTESEKLEFSTDFVKRKLGELGLEMPDLAQGAEAARLAFRALVESQDVSTEAGRTTYVALLNLTSAFAQITQALEEAAAENLAKKTSLQIDILRAQGREADAIALERAKEMEGLADYSDEVRSLQRRLWELQDAASASDTAMAALQRAIDAQRESAEAAVTAAQEQLNAVEGLFDLLRTNVRELYGEVDSTKEMSAAAGRDFITKALGTARATGYLPEEEPMGEAIDAVRGGLVAENYAAKFDFDRDRLRVASQLKELQEMAGTQKSTAELALEAAEKQLKELDNIFENAQEQLDALRGIDISVLSVANAVDRVRAALAAEAATKGVTSGTGGSTSTGGAVWGGTSSGSTSSGSTSTYTGYRREYSAATTAGSGSAYTPVSSAAEIARLDKLKDLHATFNGTGNLQGLLDAIQGAGGSLSDLQVITGHSLANWKSSAASIGHSIPAFDKGTDYVPEDMLAYIHKGERIQPAEYSRSDATNAEILGALQAIERRLSALHSDNQAENLAIAGHVAAVSKTLKRVAPDDSLNVNLTGQDKALETTS